MPIVTEPTQFDLELLDAAIAQAEKSAAEGGIPIGAAIGTPELGVVASGHNERLQNGDTTAHGEVSCFRNAGRRNDWHTLTLASTLSPCIMCSGTAILHKIPRVVIGESETFMGAEDLMIDRGVQLVKLHDERCIALMRAFIGAHPEEWNEDIGIPPEKNS